MLYAIGLSHDLQLCIMLKFKPRDDSSSFVLRSYFSRRKVLGNKTDE